MDREQVDGWLAGVDELLAGRRDDESVSEDAMRWSPDKPVADEWHPTGLLDLPQMTIRINAESVCVLMPNPEALARLQQSLTDAVAAWRAALAGTTPLFERLSRQVVSVAHAARRAAGEDVELAPKVADARFRRALEARRSRDTGPPLPPLGRRVR